MDEPTMMDGMDPDVAYNRGYDTGMAAQAALDEEKLRLMQAIVTEALQLIGEDDMAARLAERMEEACQ